MNIFVLEDNKCDQQILIKNLNNCLGLLNIEYYIHSYMDERTVIKDLEKCDLLFLDIELNSFNGIDFGKKIKKEYPECRIIIVSSYQKYLVDGYKIHADRYFLKPLLESEFQIEISNLIEEYYSHLKFIKDDKLKPNKLFVKDILYVEAMDKHTLLHMRNDKIITTPYSLKEWMSRLKNCNFEQSHKAYFINLKYVSNISKRDVILFTEELVPLSRGYKKMFEERYISNLYKTI